MRQRWIALIEVSLVFLFIFFLFRFVQSTALAVQLADRVGGRPLLPYVVLLAVGILLVALRRPTRSDLPLQGRVIAAGFFPVFVLSVLLNQVSWSDWGGALVITLASLGLLVWFGWLLRGDHKPKIKPEMAAALILLPAASFAERLGSALAALVFFYGFVGLGEEIIFRGYLQARLNTAFGRPLQFFGVRWGWGGLIAVLFFGLWHWGPILAAPAWPHMLWTLAAGLIFGLAWEKSESVLAPAVLHGIMDYGPQAVIFALFFTA